MISYLKVIFRQSAHSPPAFTLSSLLEPYSVALKLRFPIMMRQAKKSSTEIAGMTGGCDNS